MKFIREHVKPHASYLKSRLILEFVILSEAKDLCSLCSNGGRVSHARDGA